jgi:hypothetical protein
MFNRKITMCYNRIRRQRKLALHDLPNLIPAPSLALFIIIISINQAPVIATTPAGETPELGRVGRLRVGTSVAQVNLPRCAFLDAPKVVASEGSWPSALGEQIGMGYVSQKKDRQQ